jgi:hypothetical protein
MAEIDDYILDVLLRDLVGHDRRPVSFLVFLWLFFEQQRSGDSVQISYVDLAENVGISKSSAQGAIKWLISRQLLSTSKKSNLAAKAGNEEMITRLLLSSRSREMLLLLRMLLD